MILTKFDLSGQSESDNINIDHRPSEYILTRTLNFGNPRRKYNAEFMYLYLKCSSYEFDLTLFLTMHQVQ